MHPKQIFVCGILLLCPAFVMYQVGSIKWDRASRLDAEPELVKLQQLADGDVSNQNLFLVSDFRVGDHCYSSDSEGETTLKYCSVPLYASGHEEDSGENILAFVSVQEATNANQLYHQLSARPLLVQKWDERGNAHKLANVYPNIQWDKVTYVSAGDELPTFLSAGMYWAGVLACLIGALASIYYTAVIHLDVFGRRKHSQSLHYETGELSEQKLKKSDVNMLEPSTQFYLAQGFESLGYMQSDFSGTKMRHALFLSPDGCRLLSLALQKKHATPTMIGIASNGTCISIGRADNEGTIDGAADGVPLMMNVFPGLTNEQVITGFQTLTTLLPEGNDLVQIDPTCAKNLIRYQTLLMAWWFLINGRGHETPDPVPDREDLFRCEDGITKFCWNARSDK